MAAPTLPYAEASSGATNALPSSSCSLPGISFSCNICYEGFDAVIRPPMVLPCGHTYVCLLCTKQIKRCMECREPLYLITPSSSSHGTLMDMHSCSPTKVGAPLTLAQMRSLRREATRSGLSTSSTPSKTSTANFGSPLRRSNTFIPLPIPKNLVLLAMMEQCQEAPSIVPSYHQPLHTASLPISDIGEMNEDTQETYLAPPPLLPRQRSVGQGFETTLLTSDEVSVVEADEEYQNETNEAFQIVANEIATTVVGFLSKAFEAASLARSYSMQEASSSKDEEDDPALQ